MPCLTASNATLAGSAPSAPRTTSAPTRAPQVSSWSAAAARNVSAAPSSTRAPVGDEHAGELAAGGRLAGAVDADDQDDRGRLVVRRGVQRPVQSGADLRRAAPRCSSARTSAGRAGAEDLHLGPQVARRSRGSGATPTSAVEQRVLDLVPGVVVERVAGEQRQQALPRVFCERASRDAQPDEPARGRRRHARPRSRCGASATGAAGRGACPPRRAPGCSAGGAAVPRADAAQQVGCAAARVRPRARRCDDAARRRGSAEHAMVPRSRHEVRRRETCPR